MIEFQVFVVKEGLVFLDILIFDKGIFIFKDNLKEDIQVWGTNIVCLWCRNSFSMQRTILKTWQHS